MREILAIALETSLLSNNNEIIIIIANFQTRGQSPGGVIVTQLDFQCWVIALIYILGLEYISTG